MLVQQFDMIQPANSVAMMLMQSLPATQDEQENNGLPCMPSLVDRSGMCDTV